MIIKNVSLTQLLSHPLNNKIYDGNMEVDDLADNISKVGLLEPLVVISSGKGKSYYVISGNRRLKALKLLGWKKTNVNKVIIDKKNIPFFIVSYNTTRIKKASTLVREIEILEKFYSIGRGKRTYQEKFVNLTNKEKVKGDTRKIVSEMIGISSGQTTKLKTIFQIKPILISRIDRGELTINQAYQICERHKKENESITTNTIKGVKNQSSNRINIFHKSSVDMSEIPDGKISAIITSPVFYKLRSYSKNKKELGNEKNVKDYISNVCDIMDECYRVLSKNGVMFVHLGDTYNDKGSLMNVPHMLVLEMMKRNPLILHNNIIYKKVNPTPNSVKKRLSTSYEYVFFFTKSNNYYFNHIRIKSKTGVGLKSVPYHRGDTDSTTPLFSDGKKNIQDYLDNDMLDIISAPVSNQIKTKKKFNLIHPCPFPEGLSRALLALVTPNLSKENRIEDMSNFHLLDPFMGIGGLLFDGHSLGMSVWGYDTNSNYTKVVIREFNRLK